MELWINGVLVQEGNVDLMIYQPLTVIEEISSFSTLQDNDIVMTGTPKGVGTFEKGDRFMGKIFLEGREIISQEWTAL
jgi:2-keto-4-pentenoate hydratase/2-oxohepta-3-ene-1,7-dioic acid hydratase in catechol pathway